MDQIIDAVEHIRAARDEGYGVGIDCSVRQGRDAMLAHLEFLEETSLMLRVDSVLDTSQQLIASLRHFVQPHHLPDDYRFFLEYYGGLNIGTIGHRLQLYGVGPMTEEAYSGILSDEAIAQPDQDGVLAIGSFYNDSQPDFWEVLFFLDLAGTVQQHNIIGVRNDVSFNFDPLAVIHNISRYPDYWRKEASSFTNFLELIADTKGRLRYV